MSINRSKMVFIGLLFSLLVCLLAGIGMITRYQKMTACYDNRPPLIEFVLTIDTSQRMQVVEHSQDFANKHDLKFDIVYYTPDQKDFLIDMKGDDVEIIVSNPFEPGEFEVGFYNNNCINPIVASDLDSLASDLKNILDEIPSAIITEEE